LNALRRDCETTEARILDALRKECLDSFSLVPFPILMDGETAEVCRGMHLDSLSVDRLEGWCSLFEKGDEPLLPYCEGGGTPCFVRAREVGINIVVVLFLPLLEFACEGFGRWI
jgi:hypothetical protein